jgi:hypothetical protein
MSKEKTRFIFVTSSAVAAELSGRFLKEIDGDEVKPVIDYDTFSIQWKGEMCLLRNGKPFALFERLHQRPGAYVRVEDLIDELWPDNVVERNTVQKTASRLQSLLRKASMTDLIIDGKTNPGHYALVISSAGSQ